MKYLMSLGLCLLFLQPAFSQFKIGPRVAISSSGISANDLVIRNGQDVEELSLRLQESTPQYQFGVFSRFTLGPVFIQPELLVSTSRADYAISIMDFNTGIATEDILTERDFDLEVPMMAGLKLGPVRVQGGPVYRVNLGNTSELKQLEGIGRSFKEASLGMQAGLGLDLGKKVAFDLKYELDLKQTQDEITFLGNTHQVSRHGGRLVAALGVAF
ncbi:MAG: porin family protein [Bacteroidota bacterium]